MRCIYTAVVIHKPIEVVFDYVTTPGNWPEWHPSSLRVQGATDHPLEPGEQVWEEFLVAGRRGYVVWTVRERTAPHRWMIEGRIEGRQGGGTVVYTLTAYADGTRFEREFTYDVPGRLGRVLDWLVIRRRITAESALALRRLKERVEATSN